MIDWIIVLKKFTYLTTVVMETGKDTISVTIARVAKRRKYVINHQRYEYYTFELSLTKLS